MIGTNFDASLIIVFKNFASNDWNICIRIDGETTICHLYNKFIIKMASWSAEDKAMYSASVVLSATRVYILGGARSILPGLELPLVNYLMQSLHPLHLSSAQNHNGKWSILDGESHTPGF
jgi:hypothetical protein